MKINVDRYRNSKPAVMRAYKAGGLNGVTFFCTCSGVPCAAAYSFVLEDFEDEDAVKQLNGVIDFYKYNMDKL